jgi:hypothetical protein
MSSGLALLSMAFIKNLCVYMRRLILVNKKSKVFPSLSTAL